MSPIVEVTDANFAHEVLSSPLPVMLDLWGDWCEPCKALDPVVGEIARTFAGKMKVCKMDVATNPRSASALHVQRVVGQHVGGARARELVGKISHHLGLVN
jgi:thioredoxin-like negative regulator of GroEL